MGDTTNTTSNSGTSSTSPWAPQASAIQGAFTDASNIYNQRMAQGPYTGNYVAGQSAGQGQAIDGAFNYLGGEGQTNLNNVGSTSQSLLDGTNQYDINAENLAGGVAGPNQGDMGVLNSAAEGQGGAISSGLTGALNGAAIAGANNIAGYNAGLQNTLNYAAQDPTKQLAADAGEYMNSAPIQGALTQANSAINNTLNDTTIPGLNEAASANGGENSSRAGAIQGMDQYNAATAIGNADSSIDNNAFNTGLGTAASQRSTDIADSLQGNESGMAQNAGIAENQQANNLATQGMENSAASTALSTGLGYEGLNAQTQEAGNAQLGNATSMGLGAAQEEQGLAQGNYQLGAAAGGLQQQGTQEADTNALDQYTEQNTYAQNALNSYYGIVGGNNWGGNTTSSNTGTQTQEANPWTTGIGAVMSGAGMVSNFMGYGGGGGGSSEDPWSGSGS